MSTNAPHRRPFVLLTGATGLVGGLVLAELLRHEIPVAVVVRENRRQSAKKRVETLMQRLEERFQQLFVRPVVLSGDLCVPGLGLSEGDRVWLAENCGSVIHSAANLLFRPANEHPHHEPYRTNVDGTRHLLDVTTAAGIAEWHYVSTAYIAGLRIGRVFENESEVGQQFGNDYERSKTMAEQMLRERGETSGVAKSQNPLIRPSATFSPWKGEKGQGDGRQGHSEREATACSIQSLTVYRPSIVIDLHLTSSMRSDQTINSAFTMFQALSQRFGLPEPGEWIQLLGFGGHECKNIVTVDWVARMMTQIYRRPALHGQTYHLTNSTGLSASALEEGFRAACEQSGARFPTQRREAAASFNQQAAPFVAAFSPYFRDDPQFDRTNITRAMDICGERDVPSLTVEQLRDFCLRQIKPAASAATATAEPSAWGEFVTRVERRGSSLIPNAEPRGTFVGLELCGPGGGQWLMEIAPGGLALHVAVADRTPVRWIATAATMNQLIAGRLSVEHAIESGQLMVESDPALDSSGAPGPDGGMASHIEQFCGLVSLIQQHQSGHHGQKPEVIHVG